MPTFRIRALTSPFEIRTEVRGSDGYLRVHMCDAKGRLALDRWISAEGADAAYQEFDALRVRFDEAERLLADVLSKPADGRAPRSLDFSFDGCEPAHHPEDHSATTALGCLGAAGLGLCLFFPTVGLIVLALTVALALFAAAAWVLSRIADVSSDVADRRSQYLRVVSLTDAQRAELSEAGLARIESDAGQYRGFATKVVVYATAGDRIVMAAALDPAAAARRVGEEASRQRRTQVREHEEREQARARAIEAAERIAGQEGRTR